MKKYLLPIVGVLVLGIGGHFLFPGFPSSLLGANIVNTNPYNDFVIKIATTNTQTIDAPSSVSIKRDNGFYILWSPAKKYFAGNTIKDIDLISGNTLTALRNAVVDDGKTTKIAIPSKVVDGLYTVRFSGTDKITKKDFTILSPVFEIYTRVPTFTTSQQEMNSGGGSVSPSPEQTPISTARKIVPECQNPSQFKDAAVIRICADLLDINNRYGTLPLLGDIVARLNTQLDPTTRGIIEQQKACLLTASFVQNVPGSNSFPATNIQRDGNGVNKNILALQFALRDVQSKCDPVTVVVAGDGKITGSLVNGVPELPQRPDHRAPRSPLEGISEPIDVPGQGTYNYIGIFDGASQNTIYAMRYGSGTSFDVLFNRCGSLWKNLMTTVSQAATRNRGNREQDVPNIVYKNISQAQEQYQRCLAGWK